MGRHRITVNVLNDKSIDRAIKYLESYKGALETELARQMDELVEKGADTARGLVAHDTEVTAGRAEGGWEITAKGESLPFIEFGSGVHYNGDGSSYPLPKPAGIVGIGEYGMGHGKQHTWTYRDKATGTIKATHGVAMRMPMANASETMHSELKTIKFTTGEVK